MVGLRAVGQNLVDCILCSPPFNLKTLYDMYASMTISMAFSMGYDSSIFAVCVDILHSCNRRWLYWERTTGVMFGIQVQSVDNWASYMVVLFEHYS